MFVQPVAASHESIVHAMPSSQSVPDVSVPRHRPPASPWQTSAVVQAFPSSHPTVIPVPSFMHPSTLLQASAVQRLPSSHRRSTGVFVQPVARSQVSIVQSTPSSQSSPDVSVPWHVPETSPRHTSPVVQPSPSSHARIIPVPSCTQPSCVSQVSAVQRLPSSHWRSAGVFVQPVAESHESVVQAMPSSQSFPDVSVP